MDDKLFKEVSDMLSALEISVMDYTQCSKPDEGRYNDIIEDKEDTLITLVYELINASSGKLGKTKRKLARCKEKCNALYFETDCLESIIEMLEDQLRDANHKIDVARSELTLLSPILNAWEEDDNEWDNDVIWHAEGGDT